VNFQNVFKLTIFVEDNHGDDETIISSLVLNGSVKVKTDMNVKKRGWGWVDTELHKS